MSYCNRNGHARGRERTTKRRLLRGQLTMLSTTSAHPTAPLTYQPAVRASFRSPRHTKRLWTRSTVYATNQELSGLQGAETWYRPSGSSRGSQVKPVGQSDETGKVAKAKARLVAEGFRQCPGMDYNETVAPTLAAFCIRLMAAIVCELHVHLCHFDVQQAFVQAELKEVVLMRMPRGCGALSGKVVRLNRSIYGLKQASRSWRKHLLIATHPKSLGLSRSLRTHVLLD